MATESTEGHGKIKNKNIILCLYPFQWREYIELWFNINPIIAKSSCRSGRLAASAPEDGAPTGWSQNLTISEFQNQDTRIHFIL
jgi:hypothetical protein